MKKEKEGPRVPGFLASKLNPSPASSKGELVDRWQRKAADLEKIADRRESMDEDVSSLRNMAFTLTECALALTQAKF